MPPPLPPCTPEGETVSLYRQRRIGRESRMGWDFDQLKLSGKTFHSLTVLRETKI